MSVQSSNVILCKYRWLWGFQRAFGSVFQTLKISDPAFFNYFQLCFSPEGPLKKYLRELVILPPCKIQRWIRKSQPFHLEKIAEALEHRKVSKNHQNLWFSRIRVPSQQKYNYSKKNPRVPHGWFVNFRNFPTRMYRLKILKLL